MLAANEANDEEAVSIGETLDADEAEPAGTFAAGTLIGNAFRIVAPLGTGSMGAVYLAHDETLDRRVAIKFARSRLLDAGLRKRFLEEARAMARVSHPNVLQVYAFGEHEGIPYFAMEFAARGTLTEWMARSSEVPLDVALRLLDELCRGVSAIHAADIIHRDIKPDNVLLDDELRPRVADLGLAILDRQEQSGVCELVGTPAYMAPEIAFSRDVIPGLRSRADVYSLGCVAYQLLTGQPPFDGLGNVGMLLQHALNPVVPPSRLRADLPHEIDVAILRALTKDPFARTATPEELRLDLAAAANAARGSFSTGAPLSGRDQFEANEPVSRVVAREVLPCADGERAGGGDGARVTQLCIVAH
jgi:eukaryotic-like serine/threonine-protein kinase